MNRFSRRDAALWGAVVLFAAHAFTPYIEYSKAAANDAAPVATSFVQSTPTSSPIATPTPSASPEVSPSPTPANAPMLEATPTATPFPTVIDVNARALLAQIPTSYVKLKTFSANARLSVVVSGEENRADVAIKWQKPNQFEILESSSGGVSRTVSVGASVFRTDSQHAKQYLKITLPKEVQNLSQSMAFAGAREFLLSSLGEIVRILQTPALQSLTLVDDATAGTKTLNAVANMNGVPTEFIFVVDAKTSLLRQAKLRFTRGGVATEGTETYTNVRANPSFSAATFRFVPPVGAKLVVPPAPPLPYDARLKNGEAPFAFTAKTTGGADVSPATYKGRVLLLQFWASWHAPSVAELTKTKTLYAKYHAKGFDILGLSLDLEPKTLRTFVQQQKIVWPQIYDTATHGKIAVLYGVRAIPMTILVARDGKIIAADLHGDALEKAVQLALAKK